MSDPKKPSDVNDLRARLGLGSSAPSSASPGPVPPPALGGPPNLSPPPALGASQPNLAPPPALGGASPVVPPPSLGASVPAPLFGAKPQVDVAPPPFLAKKKKSVKRIIQEEFEDIDPIEDPKARARVRKAAIVCLVLAIPVFGGFFYYGKSRQGWALEDRSRADAATLVDKLTKAGPVLEEVRQRTAAALAKARSYELDEPFLDFIRDSSERRPLQSSDLDNLNFAAFEPSTVDGMFELSRTVDEVWARAASHRTLTKTDLAALQSAGKMGGSPGQIHFGVVLMNLDAETFGASIGVIGNPGVDDEGNQTVDLQARTGRRAAKAKVYTEGPLGDNAREFVFPVAPEQTVEGGPLAKAEPSHFARYIDRLEQVAALADRAVKLSSELRGQLQSVAE